jgi:hypothetical protein
MPKIPDNKMSLFNMWVSKIERLHFNEELSSEVSHWKVVCHPNPSNSLDLRRFFSIYYMDDIILTRQRVKAIASHMIIKDIPINLQHRTLKNNAPDILDYVYEQTPKHVYMSQFYKIVTFFKKVFIQISIPRGYYD